MGVPYDIYKGDKMNIVIKCKIDGKEGTEVILNYTNTTQKFIDLISSQLKAAVKKLIHHDLHKDPTPQLKEITGDIVLPETKGDMNLVLSLVVDTAPENNFSITYPKADDKTVIRVEDTLLKLLIEMNHLKD